MSSPVSSGSPHALSAAEAFERYGGLTSAEAARRLAKFGPNEPAPVSRRGSAAALLGLFLNPLVLILLIAGTASAFLGQKVDAVIIVAMVLLGVAINFVQTYRSQAAIDALRAQVTLTATVCRDHQWIEVPRRLIVEGDVIRLSAGDLIPADGRLLESRDLHVQQAALTGESMPAGKEAAPEQAGEDTGPGNPACVFLGTSVVSGFAVARVVATGPGTRFGDIAKQLAARPEETEFERGLTRFGHLIMRSVVFLVLFLLVVSIAMHRDPFESLLFAVALAVGLTPEFLPMISAVTLAKGAVRMSRNKVIVKHLASIQNFGSIDILCSDKTGTLTTGEMTLEKPVDALGGASDRARELGCVNSQCETGIKSPLDAAILRQCAKVEGYRKLDEIPFDFERRRLSVVVEQAGERLLITKGAPEGILEASTAIEVEGVVRPVDSEGKQRIKERYAGLGVRGFRVLAVAYRKIEEKAAYSREDERDLVLAGFLPFFDPPHPDAADALAELKRDGVSVKILTGDNEFVTRHICEQVGLNAAEVVLGADIEKMTEPALAHVVENNSVFARLSPGQKNRIILALKHRGHVVGYMGDGINDAPSLHAADVGISVSTAVDVARDAADIILLEPGLRVLHKGILEGRKAFGNVMKYLLMGTSSNFGNMFSMAGAALFLPFLPMLPTQILLNNFLYDLAQVTIPTDRVDDEFIRRPQKWDIGLVQKFMLTIGPISSIYDFLTFWVMIQVFHANETLFHTGWFVESLATQTLVLFVIRTMKSPWKSRPSLPLTVTTVAVALTGLLLPFLPIGRSLGFVPLPALYFLFLAAAVATYLVLVEFAKRRLFSPVTTPSGTS